MNVKNTLIISFISMSTLCYSQNTWVVTHAVSTKIAVDSTTEVTADKNYENYLKPLKQRVDAKMNVVIGQAAETMKGRGPESLLSNFSADVYRQKATEYLGSNVDIAIVNLGGLRTVVTAGDITVGKVFELMPFENELVIVWLKGDRLYELLQYFAGMGGEGVSGLCMEIEKGNATNITVGGQPLDMDKLYSITTNDYLAAGNDRMIQLAQYVKRVNTGIKVRDMLLDYIKGETQKGNKLQSKLDGRITIVGSK